MQPGRLPFLAAFISVSLLILASLWPESGWWGINTTAFLGSFWWGLPIVSLATILLLAVAGDRFAWLNRTTDAISTGLFENRLPQLLLIAAFAVLFILLRARTHFLGDGYTWISVMGQSDQFVQKWTEYGSSLLVRWVQSLLGGYSTVTATKAFQLLSVLSGLITLANLLGISRLLGRDASTRFLSFISLSVTGTLLLFFGYVEFYPMHWAAATTFVYLALRYIEKGRGLIPALCAAAIAPLVHLQAVFMLPAALLLIIVKLRTPDASWRPRAIHIVLSAVLTAAGLAMYLYVIDTSLSLRLIFLPAFAGRMPAPEYTMFSTTHLKDIANLVLVVCPAVLVLLTLAITGDRKESVWQPKPLFLALLALCSFLFLIMIDPIIGMARDWDLFSLTVLPLVLLLLYFAIRRHGSIPQATTVAVLLVSLTVTATYLASNLNVRASEDRIHSILRHSGKNDRNGWVIFSRYLRDTHQDRRFKELVRETNTRFPEHLAIKGIYDLIGRGNTQEALAASKELITYHPYSTEYLQVLGIAYASAGQTDSAVYCFERALQIKPDEPSLNGEFGLMYLRAGRFEEAVTCLTRAHELAPSSGPIVEDLAMACFRSGQTDRALGWGETLFASDPNSSGGHLLYMIVAIRDGDMAMARQHFEQFRIHGTQRVDYQTLLDHYGQMLKTD